MLILGQKDTSDNQNRKEDVNRINLARRISSAPGFPAGWIFDQCNFSTVLGPASPPAWLPVASTGTKNASKLSVHFLQFRRNTSSVLQEGTKMCCSGDEDLFATHLLTPKDLLKLSSFPNHKINSILTKMWHKKTSRYWEKVLKMKLLNFQAPMTPCLTLSCLFRVLYHCKILLNPGQIPVVQLFLPVKSDTARLWNDPDTGPRTACPHGHCQLTQEHRQHCHGPAKLPARSYITAQLLQVKTTIPENQTYSGYICIEDSSLHKGKKMNSQRLAFCNEI